MEDNSYHINDDYLDDDDDGIMYSTKNYCSDSDEDDLTAFLSKKAKKKSKFAEFADDDDESDEEDNEMDDFEKEMAAELNATMEKIMAPYISKPSTSGKEAENADGEDTHYDKIYFDSDEDDDSSVPEKRKDKHKIIPDDDLFYDPLMDDEDQAWVDNNRRKYQLRSKKLTKDGKIKPQALPHSDAVLNCPACFSTLCHDCQRHEIYKNQYRAMFVFNCIVDKSERLHFGIKEDKKKKFKKGKKRKQISSENESSKMEDCEGTSSTQDTNQDPDSKDGNDEIFYPVKCALCNTKIAVQDEDEVYHFFNVLTSY